MEFSWIKRKLVGLTVLAAAIALVASFVLWVNTDTVPSKVVSLPALPEIRWEAEASQSYRTLIESDVLLTLPAAMGQQRVVQRISAILNLRIFDVQPEEVRAGFQFSRLSYRVNGMRDSQIEPGLTAPFVAIFGPRGQIRSFEFPEQLGDVERYILSEALRHFQVVLPDADLATGAQRDRSWSIAETHATGDYVAIYQLRNDSAIQKQKSMYSNVNPAFGESRSAKTNGSRSRQQVPDLEAEPVRSASLIRLGDGVSWLQSVALDERIVIKSGQNSLADSSVQAELELLSQPPHEDLALMASGPWANVLTRTVLSSPTVAAPLSEMEKAGLVRDRAESLAGLVAALNGEQVRSVALLHGIVQMLVNTPELALEIEQALRAPELTTAAEPRLIHALAMAGTVESQQVLHRMAEDSTTPTFNRVRAIVALGSVEDATGATFDTLVRMSQHDSHGEMLDLSTTALLAIGRIGAAEGPSQSNNVAKVNEYLAQNLLTLSTDRELEIGLKAIGNTRDARLQSVVTPYFDHLSPQVRASAVETFSKLQSVGTLDTLAQQLVMESDPLVRASIATGIYSSGEVSVDSLALVSERIADESSSQARYQMIRYLGENLDLYPESREILSRLALADRSKRIRNYATATLLRDDMR